MMNLKLIAILADRISTDTETAKIRLSAGGNILSTHHVYSLEDLVRHTRKKKEKMVGY